MTIYVHTKFEVNPEKIDQAHELINEYANHVAEYVRENNDQWTWITYCDSKNPAVFLSISTHADESAEQRHRATDGTKNFAERLYPNVVGGDETRYELVDSSLRK